MKQLYTSIFILFSFANLFAQAELGFSDNLNCGNDTYCVDLEVNATTGNTFDIGTSSFLATYDQEVLTYSNYTPVEFDASTASCSNIWAAQQTDLDEQKGQFGLTIRLENNAGGCTAVSNTPMVVGTLCFDINRQGSIPNITFDNVNSLINDKTTDDGSSPITIASIDTLNVANSLACNCTGAGDPCDDQNVFTINDQYDIYCNCRGTLVDADVDGIYDGVDNCMDVFYEAEDGILVGAKFENDEPQYNGTGFVDYQSSNGDTIALDIIIDSLGAYDLIFRYANGSSDNRVLEVYIGTTLITNTLTFAPTGDWHIWSTVSFTQSINAGTHMLYLITSGEHGPNLDRVAVSSCGNCAQAGTNCDDGDPCTDSDTYDVDCNCKGVYSDTDNDGVCDNQDICPEGDDSQDKDSDGIPDACDPCDNNTTGTACDDGDPCTINDMYDADCNCVGTFMGGDADADGVCDAQDQCPGFDDNLDIDGDGTPDDCDSCNDLTVGQPCDDGNSCTILDVVLPGCGCGGIPIYLELSHNIDTIKCNGDLASIDITPEHMVGGVYYKWSTGAFSEDLSDLSPGTYSVTATDWRNCAVVESFEITDTAPINLNFTVMGSDSTNGSIDLTVTGGAAPYTYLWEDSTTTQDLTGLVSDRFYVTVTDSLACSVTGFVDVPIDTMCNDTLLQYEYGVANNLQNVNYDFGPAMDGYIRLANNDNHSSVTHYYDFPEYGNYEFNIRHAEKQRNRTVNIYLDGVKIHTALFLPLTGSDSVFHHTTFTIDSIPPGVHAIMTERNGTSNNNSRLDYLAVCKTQSHPCSDLTGNACDDGDPCSINDVLDANCNCAGTYMDTDNDGVCDNDDICPGFDDSRDSDGDGTPDGCDNCYAIKYEAEDAVRISMNYRTSGSGWTGTGYVDYNSTTGDTLRFSINAPLAGTYDIALRYAINKNDRYLDVFVNKNLEIDSLFFPNTGSANTKWEELNFNWTLNAGINIIEIITDGAHGPNIDYMTVCLPNFSHTPMIARENDGYEDGMNNWAEITFNGSNSTLIETSTTNVLCGINSMHYAGASGIEKLYADIEFLRLDSIYTLHFYAAGDSAVGYIGTPDQILNGQFFTVDATSGNGDFVHHSVTFTATAPTMRIWFEFYPFTPLTLDAFSFDNTHCFIDIEPKALLGGAFDSNHNLMYDSLRQCDLIPLAEPYSKLENFVHQARGGGESTTATILQTTGNNAIVDWVMLELRDKDDSTQVVATKSALIQRDGDIVGIDGTSKIEFRTVAAGDYYFAVRHRNHAGVMTAAPITFGSSTTSIDFTNPVTSTFGNNAQESINSILAMWAGDVNGDGLVKYNGWGNDRIAILSNVTYANPDSIIVDKYLSADVNMDGDTKYNGASNDRGIILNEVGIPAPNNILSGNIPGIGLPAPLENLQIRATNGSDDLIKIQIRCNLEPCPTTADEVADLVFGLKWPSSTGIELGLPTNAYSIGKSDGELTNGAFEYQAFGVTQLTNLAQDWTLNKWRTVTTVAVENMDVEEAQVELCETSFLNTTYPNINFILGDSSSIDYTPVLSNTNNNTPTIDDDYVDNDDDNVPNAFDCAPNDNSDGLLVINDNPLQSGAYKNDNIIESAAVLDNNSNVLFKASQSVKLLPGFKSTGGTQFVAKIEDVCSQLKASIAGIDVTCFGNVDGSATASGARGDGNYNYVWSTGATTNNISGLAPGSYGVTITDGSGEMDSTTVNIAYDTSDSDNDQITDGCDCNPNDASDGVTPVNDNPMATTTYTAPNKMTSTGIANSGAVTTLKATHNIILLPGFKAENGSQVIITIEDVCVPPALPLWADEEDDTEEMPVDLYSSEQKETALKTGQDFVFAPNPTADYFKIISEDPVNAFGIYDLLGKEIFRGNRQEVDITNLAAGTYLVRVFFEEKVGVGLIVKQ